MIRYLFSVPIRVFWYVIRLYVFKKNIFLKLYYRGFETLRSEYSRNIRIRKKKQFGNPLAWGYKMHYMKPVLEKRKKSRAHVHKFSHLCIVVQQKLRGAKKVTDLIYLKSIYKAIKFIILIYKSRVKKLYKPNIFHTKCT